MRGKFLGEEGGVLTTEHRTQLKHCHEILRCQVKPIFLSICKSLGFSFNIDGMFLIWLKFNLLSNRVWYYSFLLITTN